MTTLEHLQSISNYPIPEQTIRAVALERGLDLGEISSTSSSLSLAQADLMTWLSNAPNISQEGISYSLSQSERQSLRERAERLYRRYLSPQEAEALLGKRPIRYGYRGHTIR